MDVIEVIHCNVKTISYGKGRSVISVAAYCSGERLHSERNGLTYFEKRNDVVYEQILLPENAPKNFNSRKILWNEVEKIEKAANARTARLVEVSLPVELDRSEQIDLIINYVNENLVNRGMCADVCVHDKGNGKVHSS